MNAKININNRIMKSRELLNRIIPLLGLVIMIILFQFLGNGRLLTKGNLNSILNQTIHISIMALGAVFVFAHGGMDLSYGGVIGFSVLMGILVAQRGVPISVVFVVNVFSALVWYLLNGIISVYLNVSAFVTSLCVMYICRGILNTVCAIERYSIPVEMFQYDNWTVKIIAILLVFVLSFLLFEKGIIGKYNKAIGGNEIATYQSGIDVKRSRLTAYIISGLTVGIAGFVLMLRAGSVSTSTGQGMEMNVVTALVLGGVPLSGGANVKIIGALIGSFSVTILRNGLIILGTNERLVEGIQGIVLLIIVLLTYQRSKKGILE